MAVLPSPIKGKFFREIASTLGGWADTIGNFFFPGSFGSKHSHEDLLSEDLSPIISHSERQDEEIISNRAGINYLRGDVLGMKSSTNSALQYMAASMYEKHKITKISDFVDSLHETFLGNGLSRNLFDAKFIKTELSKLKAKLPPNFGLVTEKVKDFFGFEYDIIVPNERDVIIAIRVPIYHLGQVYTTKSLQSKPINVPNTPNFVNVIGKNEEVILSFNKQNPNLFFESSKVQIRNECFEKYGYLVCPNFQEAREDIENSCLYAIHHLKQTTAFKNCKLVPVAPNVQYIHPIGPNQFEVYFPKSDSYEHICPSKLPETLQLSQKSEYMGKLEIGEGCEVKIGKTTLYSKLDLSVNDTISIPFHWNNELLKQTLANLTDLEQNNETLIEGISLPSLNKTFAGPALKTESFVLRGHITIDPVSGLVSIVTLLHLVSLCYLLKSNFRKSKEIADLNSRLARIEAKITPVS